MSAFPLTSSLLGPTNQIHLGPAIREWIYLFIDQPNEGSSDSLYGYSAPKFIPEYNNFSMGIVNPLSE